MSKEPSSQYFKTNSLLLDSVVNELLDCFDFSTEEEYSFDGACPELVEGLRATLEEEPIESTELLLWIALSPLLLEISATGSEDAALVLSSQAIKNNIKREIAAYFALAMAFFLFKLIWASVE